jgi:hypothetical protein
VVHRRYLAQWALRTGASPGSENGLSIRAAQGVGKAAHATRGLFGHNDEDPWLRLLDSPGAQGLSKTAPMLSRRASPAAQRPRRVDMVSG